MPHNLRLTAEVRAEPGAGSFELGFRGSGAYQDGLTLRFEPDRAKVGWLRPASAGVSAFRHSDAEEQERATIYGVDGLERPFGLEVIVQNDIIDVCIDHRRTLVNRVPELHGESAVHRLPGWAGHLRRHRGQVIGASYLPQSIGDHHSFIESRKSCRRSSGLAGRGESLVTRCCGSVPATSMSTSAEV